MLTAEKIRARSDIELFNRLDRHVDVKRVREELQRQADKGPPSVRRRLLATSVRLSKEMAPAIRAMADECVQRLGITIPVEIYVYASPTYNAACVKPEEGRLFIMFSSSLLERFDAKLEEFKGATRRAAIELAKEWRTDRALRRLESLLVAADADESLMISGNGDVIAPSDGVIGIGSGGMYAVAAAKALLADTTLDPEQIVRKSLGIAADICVYTNDSITIEVL